MQEIRNATRDAAQPDHHWEWSSSSLEWKVSFQAQSWLLTFLAFKVMFDGPVDALWIEWLCCKWRWCFSGSWQIFEVAKGLKIITDILPRSMNTVLDDNKKLCLVSGEIIVGLQASQLPSFPASQLPSFPASQLPSFPAWPDMFSTLRGPDCPDANDVWGWGDRNPANS